MTQAQQPDDPQPRRALRGPAARPGTPRVKGLDALLREVDALRTTLQTDLSLAAGAVEAGAADLAASLLASDRDELAAFEARALSHLQRLEAEDRAEDRAEDAAPAPADVVPLAAGRRRRLTRLLPAAPLVAAAAALVGFLGLVPGAGSGRPATTDTSGTVLSSWEELSRLSAADAPPEDVQRAALDLNADIAQMVARSGGDPAAARQALALLHEAQAVLASDDDADQLTAVLRQSRALAARLLASLPPVPRPVLSSPLRSAVARPAPVPPARPSLAPAPKQQSARPVSSPRPYSGYGSTPTARPTPRSTPASPSPSARPSSAATPPQVLPGTVAGAVD